MSDPDGTNDAPLTADERDELDALILEYFSDTEDDYHSTAYDGVTPGYYDYHARPIGGHKLC